MELNKIVAVIKELGHVNSKREELRDYCSQKLDQILKLLPRRIVNSDGADLIGCILNGIPDIPAASLKNKVKVIDIVLKTMRKESTSITHCGDVVSRLCLELPRLAASDLVRLCNESVQSIVDDSDVNMIWRDIFPECTSALSAYESIKHCDTEMTPAEFKEQCIHTLCQCRWNERQLVQLAAMFKDMQLSKTSHKQVVNKICSYIIDIPPDTLPPLVHQLLKLCKQYNLEVVLSHLSHYFTSRLYSKLEPPQDSESTTMDIDDIVPHSPAELSRCLSTCIYHISQGAVEPQLVRKHIKLWPRTQLLRAPFIIDLALAISDKGPDFRSVCLDAIRCAIEQRVVDDIRRAESVWARTVIPPDVDVPSVLKVLIAESANHRQLTVMGLINLAFSLLSVFKLKPGAAACWSHGKLILVRLSKSQPETAPHILTQLADRLAHDSPHKQYADCLYILCKLTPASVERCTELSTILENCAPTATEWWAAAGVLDAVHPLLNFSTRTRDVLVMVCRKGLYSRDSLHRCLALSGFLSVLRHIRLSRSCGSSQSGSSHYSAHSYLTQLTADWHCDHRNNVTSRVRNEAVCMEVVSILRRCLVQDAAVKQLLYKNIADCVKEKPALHESILEILYEHLTKYLPENDENTPLKLDKCVQITATTAVLTEPIAFLLYAIAQFTQTMETEDGEDILLSQRMESERMESERMESERMESERMESERMESERMESGAERFNNKLNYIMEKLCKSEFQIDLEDHGLSDMIPESKAKCIKVQQILQCYESLIAYKIMQWKSSDVATSVYKLFKACNQLMEQTKAPAKLGKKGNKLNETKETVKSQKSQKSQKEKMKAPIKWSNLVKDRAGPFKPLPCVWDLKFCVRIIALLYSEELPWSSPEQRNQLISHRDFHQWCIRNLQSALAAPLQKTAVATQVLAIASVLYSRCVCRFEAMLEFDEQTALGCLELFRTCFTLLFSTKYSLKMDTVLPAITGQSELTPSACIAAILEQIHSALQKSESTGEEEAWDQMDRKIHASLIATAAALVEIPAEDSVEMSNVLVKLEDYVRSSKQESSALLSALLAASSSQQDCPLLDELLAKLPAVLGRIDEEDTSAGEETPIFPYIDSTTGHGILSLICVHLNTRFKCAEHLLHRAKDLAVAVAMAAGAHQQRIDKELKTLYKSIVVQLCQLTAWTGRCAKLRCCVGGGSDKILTTCIRLYAILASFAKQIDGATAQIVRFERLLKLSGKKLSLIIDNLITYLEASQKQENASKVLKNTKLIPRVVLEAENYSKHVIILASKAKLNWQQYLSLGTARDFRIKAPVLEEVLNARNEGNGVDDAEDNINDAATLILSPAASDQGDNDYGDEERDTQRKRRRLS